ncbi:MAG: hypothetical protein O2954_14660 [bacterium]|nr:hypothetical protein [bacterium]
MARTQEEVKRQIAEAEGFPVEKMDEFVAFIKNEPYITSSGLQFKMHQQYKAGKFAVQGVIPTPEEYMLIRRMMGLKEEEPLVVVRGEVWVEGFEKSFMDYGTATPNNLSGFIKFSDYPLEMATRRATNRAMRLATATGMCSVDEMKEPATPVEDRRPLPPASKEQVELIRNLGRNHLLPEETRMEVETFLEEAPDRRQASGMIDRLKSTLDAQRKGARQADPVEVGSQ